MTVAEVITIFTYKDVVTYVEDVSIFVIEITEKFPERLSEDGKFLVTKIPTVKHTSGTKSLCLVRCMTEQELTDLSSLTSLEVLGTYDEVFADPIKLAKYDSIYDRTPYTYTDEEGNGYEVTPPDYIGVFA